jgi:hypothetical protein
MELCLYYFFLIFFFFFLTFGSGEGASRKSEIWYVIFLMNYLPLILPCLYLIYVIYKAKINKELMKFNSNIFVLILLLILYFFKEYFITLFLN